MGKVVVQLYNYSDRIARGHLRAAIIRVSSRLFVLGPNADPGRAHRLELNP